MKICFLLTREKHSSDGALLLDPTLLILWAWPFRVARDPTGRSHFLKDDLYLEPITTSHHIQKPFPAWPWLLIRVAKLGHQMLFLHLERGLSWLPCPCCTGSELCLSTGAQSMPPWGQQGNRETGVSSKSTALTPTQVPVSEHTWIWVPQLLPSLQGWTPNIAPDALCCSGGEKGPWLDHGKHWP